MSSNVNGSDMEVGENELDILSMLIGDDEEKWRNTRGQLDLVNQCIQKGETPKDILKNHFKVNVNHLSDDALEHWSIILHLIMEGSQRKRIEDINTFQQACDLIRNSKNIVVLTGAGISVPCGVPDFRSRNGIYARLAVDFPDLDEPQSMFDIHYFLKNPKPFFQFAKEIYPGKFSPSLGHKFIKLLEDKKKLLRNYTQNIDTLEQVAGIKKIIHCHGSFASATCMRCEYKVDGSMIEDDVMNQRIPICPSCTSDNEIDYQKVIRSLDESENVTMDINVPIMKPDVVFFGEGLPKDFHSTLAEDKDQVDLLIVIGSSLKVRPVAHIPSCFPAHVPQILINKEPLSSHVFDIELLGDCDIIVSEICKKLNWNENTVEDNGTFKEKSIYDMKSEIERLNLDESDKNSENDKSAQDGDKSFEKEDDELKLLNVCDLLNEEISCIEIPPNKYVFRGAEFLINAKDVDNPESSFAPVTIQYDSSSTYSSSSDDTEFDNDDQESELEQEKEEKASEESKITEKSESELSLDSNPQTKRRRLSQSNNSEL